eukprot:702073_1
MSGEDHVPAPTSTSTASSNVSNKSDASNSKDSTEPSTSSPPSKKQRTSSPNHPDVLKNMPAGLFKLFGTADNSIRRCKLKSPKKPASGPFGPAAAAAAGFQASWKRGMGGRGRAMPTVGVSTRGRGRAMSLLQPSGPPVRGKLSAFRGGRGGRGSGSAPARFDGDGLARSDAGRGQLSDTNLYISGFPSHYERTDFMAVFAKYGSIESVYLPRSGHNAFIQFTSAPDAKRAVLEQNGHLPDGSETPWVVRFANHNSFVANRQSGRGGHKPTMPSGPRPVVPAQSSSLFSGNVTVMTPSQPPAVGLPQSVVTQWQP